MLSAIAGFFTGGGIYTKLAMALAVVVVVGGGIWYVKNLQQNLEIAEAKVAVLEASVEAEREKSFRQSLAHQAMLALNRDLDMNWAALDVGAIRFHEKVATKVDAAVKPLTVTPDSEEARQIVELTINEMARTSQQCSEIAVAGATDEDRQNPALKDFCPEVLR
jgi:hypothetical protein